MPIPHYIPGLSRANTGVKVLENSPKGTDRGSLVNDSELLSPEFATALETGKTSVIKKFVENQEDERRPVTASKTTIAERSPIENSGTKKNVPRANGRLKLAPTSRSPGGGEVLSRNGKENTERALALSKSLGPERTKLPLQRMTNPIVASSQATKRNTLPEASNSSTRNPTSSSSRKDDASSRNGEENTRRFFAELRSLGRPGEKPAITKRPIGKSSTLIPSPKGKTQSALQATTPRATTRSVDTLPISHTINNAFPFTSTSSVTTEVTNVVPPLLPPSLAASSQELSARALELHSSPEQRSQNPLLPAAADSHEIQSSGDQHPFDTSSSTLKSESRDPTPEVEEVSAPRNANSNSSPIRSFLSSLQPPLPQYAPAFEKLGVKNSDELLILKGLAPASIREFLQEVRKETDMTFLQSLAFIGGLERYSP
ncbi:hypothetical protein FRC00_006883 [Tulasnella sp. 408]|nr:hypothetical protein FRC00_006883 [Tulasnella sp. 408]